MMFVTIEWIRTVIYLGSGILLSAKKKWAMKYEKTWRKYRWILPVKKISLKRLHPI